MNAENFLLYTILFMTWVELVWNFYLVFRQRNVLTKTISVPEYLNGIISEETFSKARSYNLDSTTFGIIHSFFDNIFGTVLIVLYIMPALWNYSSGIADKVGFKDSEIVISIIFMLIMNTLNTIISLPFSIYSIFVIEEKHGFNKQTPMFFFKDTLKSYFLMQFLIVLLTSPIIYIVNAGGQYFFIYLWLFAIFFSLFFMTIYPDVIAPLFDKYSPLEDGELRTSIEELAASIQFPLKKIYVVEGSKRSAHSNAYFYGFFSNKRIVLFDTLLSDYVPSDAKKAVDSDQKSEEEESVQTENEEAQLASNETKPERKGCTNDEILAVLAHELGHWKGSHVLKQFVLSQINLFFLFMAFSFLFQYGIIYKAFGFYDSQPVIIGLLIILQFIFTPYHFIMSFLMTLLSRKYEFEADDFAKSLRRSESLKKALIKLNKDNLGFPVYDWLYSMFNHSHPQLLERLKALEKVE